MSTILANILLCQYSILFVFFIVSMIQNIIYDRKTDKRDAEREARDKEYHEKRMQEYR